MRKLQDNPNDVVAIGSMYKAQQQMNLWAQSKQLPGQFTGSTGVQVLSQQELSGPDKKQQAWIKKVGMFLSVSGHETLTDIFTLPRSGTSHPKWPPTAMSWGTRAGIRWQSI